MKIVAAAALALARHAASLADRIPVPAWESARVPARRPTDSRRQPDRDADGFAEVRR